MRASRRHLARFASTLVMTAVMTLLAASSVAARTTVAYQVSAGGPDSCFGHEARPGCDGNYSLVATLYDDGTATGQYVDRFSGGGGIVGVIDCVVVVDNQAWISGWIKSGSFEGDDLSGLPFTTLVVDNGTSANEPPDQNSTSHVGDDTPCTEMAAWDLFEMPAGQVTIK